MKLRKCSSGGKARGARAVITTEKDSVRFPRLGKRPLPVYFLRVEIEIIRGHDAFERCLERMCRYAPAEGNFTENPTMDGRGSPSYQPV